MFKLKPIDNSTEAIELAYSCTEENKREISQSLMKFIFNCIQSGNKEELDLLLLADPSLFQLYISMCILRTTFAYSSKLNNWFIFRNKVVEHCKANNIPKWENILRGLLKDKPCSNPWGGELDKLFGVHPIFTRE